MEIKPEDRLVIQQDHGGFPRWILAAGVVIVLAAGGVGTFLWWKQANKPASTREVYVKLGIPPLPADVESRVNIARYLDQLDRERCDTEAMTTLATNLTAIGYPRQAADGIIKFAQSCGVPDPSFLRPAYTAFIRLSDYRGAIEVSNEMLKRFPASAQFRYDRALAYEKLGEFKNALPDYISALHLIGELKNTAFSHFYDITRMYESLGHFCDALSPIETYVSFDRNRRESDWSKKVTVELAQKGNCRINYSTGSVRVPARDRSRVELAVMINGVMGKFLLDTGATSVAVTRAFATRAAIASPSENTVDVVTAGGIRKAMVATLGTVSVGSASAQNVAALVQDDAVGFGPGLDGLLGMSYLSRFNIKYTGAEVEFEARPLQ